MLDELKVGVLNCNGQLQQVISDIDGRDLPGEALHIDQQVLVRLEEDLLDVIVTVTNDLAAEELQVLHEVYKEYLLTLGHLGLESIIEVAEEFG